MKIPKVKIKKIKERLKRLPRALAERAFLTFFGLFTVSLILGALIFFQYSFLIQEKEPQITEEPLQFKEKNYQDVLKTWQEREERFEEADLKEYLDPFQGLTE